MSEIALGNGEIRRKNPNVEFRIGGIESGMSAGLEGGRRAFGKSRSDGGLVAMKRLGGRAFSLSGRRQNSALQPAAFLPVLRGNRNGLDDADRRDFHMRHSPGARTNGRIRIALAGGASLFSLMPVWGFSFYGGGRFMGGGWCPGFPCRH